MKAGFIGGGNMATAIIGGLLAKGFQPEQFHVVEPFAEQRRKLADGLRIPASAEAGAALAACDVIVLCVKPQQMREAAEALRPHLSRQLIITIAAGIMLADLSRWLGGHANLVRAMPNTPALIHAGISGLFAAPAVGTESKRTAEALLGAVGEVVWFDREDLLDGVTAVSGSGPAYVFYFIEALEQAALQLGMNPDQARRLAMQTFRGASELAAQSTEPPAELRARVTSKGGTTERAIATMDDAGLKDRIVDAVKAAAERSAELGRQLGGTGNPAPGSDKIKPAQGGQRS
jgi:pyrroline-5-carboxylate reductase